MNIIYRQLESHADYRAAEELQQLVWGGGEREVVPAHMLLAAQKSGGALIGAFDASARPEALAGFVFGIVARGAGGRATHYSHLLAVHPAYRGQRIGERLKWRQRDFVLGQGIGLITWTYDPLESRNAHLNIHKLGATCRTYLRDLYGSLEDELNAGLPSDRFLVDWQIASSHVAGRLDGVAAGRALAALLASDAAILNPASPSDPAEPAPRCLAPEGALALVRFPGAFQVLKAGRTDAARAWRMQLRELCEAAFASGYSVVDALRDGGQSYYLIERDWRL